MQQQQTQQNLKNKITTRVMRKALRQWRNSIIESNPQCYVTNSTQDLTVHHAGQSFSEVFRQAHKNLGIQYNKYIFEYSEEDARRLKAEIIKLHESVDAIVLNHSIHCELHTIYGTEVTRQQIDLYKKNYHAYTKK